MMDHPGDSSRYSPAFSTGPAQPSFGMPHGVPMGHAMHSMPPRSAAQPPPMGSSGGLRYSATALPGAPNMASSSGVPMTHGGMHSHHAAMSLAAASHAAAARGAMGMQMQMPTGHRGMAASQPTMGPRSHVMPPGSMGAAGSRVNGMPDLRGHAVSMPQVPSSLIRPPVSMGPMMQQQQQQQQQPQQPQPPPQQPYATSSELLAMLNKGMGGGYGPPMDGPGPQQQQQQQQQQLQVEPPAPYIADLSEFPALHTVRSGGGGGGGGGSNTHEGGAPKSTTATEYKLLSKDDFPALTAKKPSTSPNTLPTAEPQQLSQQDPNDQQQYAPYASHGAFPTLAQAQQARPPYDQSYGKKAAAYMPGAKPPQQSTAPQQHHPSQQVPPSSAQMGLQHMQQQQHPLQGQQTGLGMSAAQLHSQAPSPSPLQQAQAQVPGSTAAAGGAGSAAVPPSGKDNRYGLLGLLGVIRMTDPDLNTLALGTDLTTLGLNLNSPECLYATFASPFADSPSRRDPDYHLPLCYYVQPPVQPPSIKTRQFSEETLFYIFYSMPKDSLQLAASVELYNREWRFHKELRKWLTRAPGTEPIAKTQQFERGSYIYFEPTTWEKIRKDNFTLVYNQLEAKLQL